MQNIEYFIKTLINDSFGHEEFQLSVYPIGNGMWLAQINDANEPDIPILGTDGEVIMECHGDTASDAIAKLEILCFETL